MKIVYIVKYIAQYGGLDRILSYKMNYFAENDNNEIYLITYEQGDHHITFPLSSKIVHKDVDVRFFTRSKYALLKRLYLFFKMRIRFRRRIVSCINDINPDVIIVTTDSYTLLDILLGLKKKAKVVVENHVSYDYINKSNDFLHNPLLYKFAIMYDKYIMNHLKKCDAFISLTNDDASKWIGIKNRYIIPNPLADIPLKISSLNNKRIISVGRLESQKGYDKLLEAWELISKKHKDWELNIFGDGNLRNSLINQTNQLQISESCKIHPATKEIYDEYLKSSIYVMSSNYEGFGLVLIEAMSCGLPCVSFDCPSGPGDIIKDGEDGILVEPNNVNKLAESIMFLIENEDIRKEYGENALKNVKRYYPEIIMPQWGKLFSKLLKNND